MIFKVYVNSFIIITLPSDFSGRFLLVSSINQQLAVYPLLLASQAWQSFALFARVVQH